MTSTGQEIGPLVRPLCRVLSPAYRTKSVAYCASNCRLDRSLCRCDGGEKPSLTRLRRRPRPPQKARHSIAAFRDQSAAPAGCCRVETAASRSRRRSRGHRSRRIRWQGSRFLLCLSGGSSMEPAKIPAFFRNTRQPQVQKVTAIGEGTMAIRAQWVRAGRGRATVSGSGFPPDAGTFHRPVAFLPKMMRPSLLHHEPPIGGPGLSQISCKVPVCTSAFLSLAVFSEYTR